ncbi:hypothetical protein KGM_216093 [Danaus plexippus plexippus]|uniref:Uncharacterized protein n=1 Tax=Danaus plexippus plexippus TaxID=278856 RepID=A0A212FG99_DANPL|nr:hypothetical protein KGM_216093 [Danaus plexippus plexippus]
MEVHKIIIIWVAVIAVSVRENESHIFHKKLLKDCTCFPKDSQQPRVSELAAKYGRYERRVVYLFKHQDSGIVSIYVPNQEKQDKFPDLTVGKTDKYGFPSRYNILDIFKNPVSLSPSLISPKPEKLQNKTILEPSQHTKHEKKTENESKLKNSTGQQDPIPDTNQHVSPDNGQLVELPHHVIIPGDEEHTHDGQNVQKPHYYIVPGDQEIPMMAKMNKNLTTILYQLTKNIPMMAKMNKNLTTILYQLTKNIPMMAKMNKNLTTILYQLTKNIPMMAKMNKNLTTILYQLTKNIPMMAKMNKNLTTILYQLTKNIPMMAKMNKNLTTILYQLTKNIPMMAKMNKNLTTILYQLTKNIQIMKKYVLQKPSQNDDKIIGDNNSDILNILLDDKRNVKLPPPKDIQIPISPKFNKWLIEQIKIVDNDVLGLKLPNDVEVQRFKYLLINLITKSGFRLTELGDLMDANGRVLKISNLKLKRVMISDPAVYKHIMSNYKCIIPHDIPYLEAVFVGLIRPPKILGVIPLRMTLLPKCNGNRCNHNSRCNLATSKVSPIDLKQTTELNNVLAIEKNLNEPAILSSKEESRSHTEPELTLNLNPEDLEAVFGEYSDQTANEENVEEYNTIDGSDDGEEVIFPKIVGGNAATSSGTPVSSRGRSGYNDPWVYR